eukprot:12635348-Alexandrium_andersonii.AAC.1
MCIRDSLRTVGHARDCRVAARAAFVASCLCSETVWLLTVARALATVAEGEKGTATTVATSSCAFRLS